MKKAPEWSDSEWCMRCRSAFTMLNRKHHCRNCGLTFCGNCSSKSISLPHLAIKEPVRVCESCYTRIYSGDIKAATALAASGGSSSDLAALTAGGGNTTTAANTNAEDEDLRKAIEASLRESQKSSTIESKPATVPVATRRNDADDDDADLKAAIEASLRESSAPSTTSYNNNKSSSNQAPSYAYQPPVRSQSTSSNMSNNTSSNNNNPYASAAYTANSPSSSSSSSAPLQSSTSVVQQYMPNELSSIELENIKLFSELVEKMELDFAARGPSILNNPQIQVRGYENIELREYLFNPHIISTQCW